jgi:hypothetical protein
MLEFTVVFLPGIWYKEIHKIIMLPEAFARQNEQIEMPEEAKRRAYR